MRSWIFTPVFGFVAALTSTALSADTVTLTERDLVPVGPSVWSVPVLDLPPQEAGAPILGPEARQDGARLLRILNNDEDINGFRGILYDNRDRGHSTLDAALYPQLTFLDYGAGLKTGELDIGLGGRFFLPHVVIGNASMAMGRGPLRRSLPRLAMTEGFWHQVTPALYANNHLYVYPANRDYEGMDMFPINWPYMVISDGRSRSDLAFLGAFAMTLAAFPSDTFDRLREARLVAPTLQMILRRNLTTVTTREAYLSGIAHPPVFSKETIRWGRMVADASEMRPGDIPPLVQLRVTEETFSDAAGPAELSEHLLDSPAAIGRLWRNLGWAREMRVTAEDTVALEGQDLQFEWRLLRGDADLVEIEPEGPDGRTARIRIAWHDPWIEIGPRGKNLAFERPVSRVDIGVFANNGVYDSAPALISVDFPEHQIRQYADGADGPRLVSIDYDARGREAYFDPLLYWSAPWTDSARYDEEGQLLGWDRRGTEGETAFVPAGEAAVSVADPRIDASNPSVSLLYRGAN